MNSRVVLTSFLAIAFYVAPARGLEEAVPKPEAIAVTEAEKVEAQLGKLATVRGKVTRTGQSKGGIHFLNFANYHFVVVCFPKAVAKFDKGGPADLFKVQVIEITGTVEKYRDRFQIKLAGPEQIRIVPQEEAGASEASDKASNPNPETETETETEKASVAPKQDSESDSEKKPVDPKKFFDD